MTKANEPAFPMVDKYGRPAISLDEYVARWPFGAGLTKREYFAAMAMQGYLANPNDGWVPLAVIKHSVKCADALIAELAKAEPEDVAATADGWIEWGGGECPVDSGCDIDTITRGCRYISGRAGYYRWFHCNDDFDIMRYRIVKGGEA